MLVDSVARKGRDSPSHGLVYSHCHIVCLRVDTEQHRTRRDAIFRSELRLAKLAQVRRPLQRFHQGFLEMSCRTRQFNLREGFNLGGDGLGQSVPHCVPDLHLSLLRGNTEPDHEYRCIAAGVFRIMPPSSVESLFSPVVHLPVQLKGLDDGAEAADGGKLPHCGSLHRVSGIRH